MHHPTEYAKSGEHHISYEVFGEVLAHPVSIPGFISNMDRVWETPPARRLFGRLANFSRVIMFDKRGTGLSDRGVGVPKGVPGGRSIFEVAA